MTSHEWAIITKVDEGEKAQQKHINCNKKLANRCIALKIIMAV